MSNEPAQKLWLRLATRWLFLLVLAALTAVALALTAILDKHGYRLPPSAVAIIVIGGLAFAIIVLSKRAGQP